MVSALLLFIEETCGDTNEAFKKIQLWGERYKPQLFYFLKLWFQRIPQEIYSNYYGFLVNERLVRGNLWYEFKIHKGLLNHGDAPTCTFSFMWNDDYCYRGWYFQHGFVSISFFVNIRPVHANTGLPAVLSANEIADCVNYLQDELPNNVLAYLSNLTITDSQIQSKLDKVSND